MCWWSTWRRWIADIYNEPRKWDELSPYGPAEPFGLAESVEPPSHIRPVRWSVFLPPYHLTFVWNVNVACWLIFQRPSIRSVIQYLSKILNYSISHLSFLIICFLPDRTQTVIINGKVSSRLKINQIIVQGSGIGPILFLIYILDLKPLFILNLICKCADDTSLLTPQHTNTGLEEEFLHIQSWAKENWLKINILKTTEIVFRKPSLRH